MGAEVVIERADYSAISIDEWKQLVASDPDLRFRTEPYFCINPQTGDRIVVPVGDGDTELSTNKGWIPFLWFNGGRLKCGYNDCLLDPQNPERWKIVAIARQLGAVVRSDLGDNLF